MKLFFSFVFLFFQSFTYSDDGADYWLGRWEDNAGYWVEIKSDGAGAYVVSRSGNNSGNVQLFFMDVSGEEFSYKERYPAGFGYIHSLEPLDATSVREKWVSMQDGSLWKTNTLYKKI